MLANISKATTRKESTVATDFSKMRKKQLLFILDKEDVEIGDSSMSVVDLRRLATRHFEKREVSKSKVSVTIEKPSGKLFAKLTDKQLLALSDHFGWTEDLVDGKKGWQIKALTLAHSVPSTHAEALFLSKRLMDLLNKKLVQTTTPRLHYANKTKAGIDSRFSQSTRYYPGKFGSRSKLGSSYTLRCVDHGIQYSRCSVSIGCRVGVAIDGKWAFEIVKRGKLTNKVAPKRSNSVISTNTTNDTIEQLIEDLEGGKGASASKKQLVKS